MSSTMATPKPQRIPVSYVRLVDTTSKQTTITNKGATSNNQQQKDLSETSVYPFITNENFFIKLPTITNEGDASNNNNSWFNEFLTDENEPLTTTTTTTQIPTTEHSGSSNDISSLAETLANESELLSKTTKTQTLVTEQGDSSEISTTTQTTPQQKLSLQQRLHEAYANDDCAICMAPFSEKPISKIAITLCGHTFCQDCLEGIFKNAKSFNIHTPTTSCNCPYCRQDLKVSNGETDGHIYFMERKEGNGGLVIVISYEDVFGCRVKLYVPVEESEMEQLLEALAEGDISWSVGEGSHET